MTLPVACGATVGEIGEALSLSPKKLKPQNCGAARHDAGWSWSDKFPSLDEVNQRLKIIGDNISRMITYKIKKSGEVIYPVTDESLIKPNSGMIKQSMRFYQITDPWEV